jgi:hypothetical protein
MKIDLAAGWWLGIVVSNQPGAVGSLCLRCSVRAEEEEGRQRSSGTAGVTAVAGSSLGRCDAYEAHSGAADGLSSHAAWPGNAGADNAAYDDLCVWR